MGTSDHAAGADPRMRAIDRAIDELLARVRAALYYERTHDLAAANALRRRAIRGE